MTDLQTPREYLVSLNLAKPGRGKFSAAGHAALAEAIAKGIQFKDTTVVKAQPKVVTKSDDVAKPAVKVVTKPAERPNARNFGGLMVEAAPRYMHNDYVATDIDGSKIKRTFKDTCCGCQYSTRWCRCSDGPKTFSKIDSVTILPLATVGKVSA